MFQLPSNVLMTEIIRDWHSQILYFYNFIENAPVLNTYIATMFSVGKKVNFQYYY